MFGKCYLICMWLTLNNLFQRVLVHLLLLVKCYLICMWLTLNNLFERVLVHLLLLVIYVFVTLGWKRKSIHKGKPGKLWSSSYNVYIFITITNMMEVISGMRHEAWGMKHEAFIIIIQCLYFYNHCKQDGSNFRHEAFINLKFLRHHNHHHTMPIFL